MIKQQLNQKVPRIRGEALKQLLSDPEVGHKAQIVMLTVELANPVKSWRGLFTECFFAPVRAKELYSYPARRNDFFEQYGEQLQRSNLNHYAKVINAVVNSELIQNKVCERFNRNQSHYFVDSTKEPFLHEKNNFIYRYLVCSEIMAVLHKVVRHWEREMTKGVSGLAHHRILGRPQNNAYVCDKILYVLFEKSKEIKVVKRDFYDSVKRPLPYYPYSEKTGNMQPTGYTKAQLLLNNFSNTPQYSLEPSSSIPVAMLAMYVYVKEILDSASKHFKFNYLQEIPFEKLGLPSFNEQKGEILSSMEGACRQSMEIIKTNIKQEEKILASGDKSSGLSVEKRAELEKEVKEFEDAKEKLLTFVKRTGL